METDLEKYLQTLNSERCLEKPKEALFILNKISQCFEEEQSQFKLSLLIGLILDECDAIFSFIWKTCANYDTVSSTAAAFKLLEFLVTTFEELSQPYFCILFDKCLSLLDGKFAKVKELSLKLIKKLIIGDSRASLDLERLTSKLEKHLTNDSKMPGTVAEQIFILLGFLFEKYPEAVSKKEKWFFNKIYEGLRHEVAVMKNPSNSKIRGAFEGLNGYLVNYTPPNGEILKKIYMFMKNFSKFRLEKRLASKASLKLFQNHWRHFSDLIFKDRGLWRSNLLPWLNQSSEDRLCGFLALTSLYNVISFKVDSGSGYIDIFQSYLKDFKDTLSSRDSNSYEKKSALIGIKLFVLNEALDGDDFNDTYNFIMDFVKKQNDFGNFFYLPLCIECISAFVLRFSTKESFSSEQVSCLQRLSVMVIEEYPKIEPNFQSSALTSIETSFYMLEQCGLRVVEDHINKVIYQGLIRTCSFMTAADIEHLRETGESVSGVISYKSYLGLWKYFLNLTNSPNLPSDGSYALKKEIAVKVFDAIIESFIKVVSKLNLNVNVKEKGLEMEAEVEKPSDLTIFINCVDLYQSLIPSADLFSLTKWIPKILHQVVNLSYENPLVAGFYKIIATTLKAADNIQFFELDTNTECFELLEKFLENVLKKVDHYKGELQIVCLQTLLAAPVQLIEPFVEKTIPALIAVIRLGRNYFPLLKDLVETLERWDYYVPSSSMNVIVQEIFPHFDLFFQSQYFQGSNLVDSSIEGKKLKKKLVFNDSELLSLQKRFLMFLGSLDFNKAIHLIKVSSSVDEERKISDKNLVYRPPAASRGNVEINLDDILPRAMELATSCSDRCTRITACELLYSGAMIILSNINQLSGGYTSLFRRIIKTSLILGSDSDCVVYQIFEPLMFQIVHYFSGKKAMHFSETQDLIEILMDFVCRPYEPAVRDFSALLISEFTVWSIRQLTPAELKITPDSVKKILNNMYSLSLHPSCNKRLGAAVVFNKIYSVLREEDAVLDTNWFQLLYYFMENLGMCDKEEDTKEIEEAIEHVKRPLVERRDIFNEPSGKRIIPPEFEGGLLCHLMKWVFRRCCNVKPSTRRVAMALVEDIAPSVRHCQSLTSFVEKHFPNEVFQIEEEALESYNPEDFICWFNRQSAMFEYYAWLLEHNLLTPEKVFSYGFDKMSKNYTNGLICQQEKTFEVESCKRESVLLFIRLLSALKERAFYFSTDTWEFLKMVVFKPTDCGFNLNYKLVAKKLRTALSTLLHYFSEKLTQYNWNPFYESLETLITVPVLYYITRNRCIDVKSLEFLFALEVIEESKIWDDFIKRTYFSMNGGLIVEIIFRSLFMKRGEKVIAVSLEPSCKLYLEELMIVGSKVGGGLEGIFDFVDDATEVLVEETNKSVAKGEYFLLQFKNIIFEMIHKQGDLLVERVLKKAKLAGLNLLVQSLEYKKPEDNETELAIQVVRRWKEFEGMKLSKVAPKERKKCLLHLALSAARVIGAPGCLKTTPVYELVCAELENQKILDADLEGIESTLNLLPFLCSLEEKADENPKLESSLSKFIGDIEVIKVTMSSGKSRSLEVVIDHLLKTLKFTGSLVILRIMLTMAPLVESLFIKENLESALSIFTTLPSGHSLRALGILYDYCFENDRASASLTIVFKWYMAPLLKVAPNEAVYEFVVEKLEFFFNLITSHWAQENMIPSVARIDFMRRICAAEILQIFVMKLSCEELGRIPENKKSMLNRIIQKSFSLLRGSRPSNVLKERYRKFMCEVFNMICCIVSTRSTDPKIYKLFLFDERGSFLCEAVDKTLKFNLDMDFDEVPKRKKILTRLQKVAKEVSSSSGGSSVKYIQTNTLFSSSLREDVTKFDLTYSPIRSLDSVQGYRPEDAQKGMEIELEVDSFNSHECMPTLVGVISKMVADKVTPLPASENETCELPSWLRFFLSILKSPNFSENLKLFVLKALYNVQDYVKPFCKEVFPQVLEFVNGLFSDYPINYFLIDLIEMMIGWNCSPESKASCGHLTDLVKLIIRKSDSLRREIVKSNLEIIQTMVEVWKDVLFKFELSEFVFDRLRRSIEEDEVHDRSGSDSATYINVKISGILLMNSILPWKAGSEKVFIRLLLKNFTEGNRSLQVFAEICGLALMNLKNNSDFEDCEQLVCDKINSQGDSWLTLLYSVHKHYPEISSRFVFKIFSSAWGTMDSLTANKLEMLLSHVSRSESIKDDTFERHVHSFLIDMLNSVDLTVQKLSLQIASKLLDTLKGEKLEILMKEVFRLQKSVHPEVRKWVYEISIKYYNTGEGSLTKQCKIVLLKGLSDTASEIEQSCLLFWRKFFEATSPHLILVKTFQEMYAPEVEDIFLSNIVKVLLDFAATSTEFKKPIFAHPINHLTRFKKRNLILGSRSTVLSGFMSSRVSTNQSLEHVATLKTRNAPYLRATISSLKFDPTVQENPEEGPAPETEPEAEAAAPKNPFRRRFYKNSQKSNLSFIRWHAARKKKETEKEEDWLRKKESQVDIFGEYREGDYPDIEISHSQILKPLEALAKRDSQIARRFLVSFFSGLIGSLSPSEKADLLSGTNESFEKILESSTSFDPAVFGFVLQILLKYCESFDVDSEKVSNAAVSSNWISLGALILEQIIAKKEDEVVDTPKRSRGCSDAEEINWLELAKLYRSLEEYDVLSGILLDKVNVPEDGKKAVRLEALLDWSTALKFYESALKTDSDSRHREFFTESYFVCSAKLSNWSLLNECIQTTVEENLDDLWKNYNLLSWFLKSEMMVSLRSGKSDFQTTLNDFSKSKSKLNILNSNFGEELAVFDWLSGKVQRASYRVNRLCLDFLAGWSHLNRWSYNLRAGKLADLQTLSELGFAVKTLAESSRSELEQNIKIGKRRWEKNLPSPRDDLTIWDIKLSYRRQFFKQLKDFSLSSLEMKSNLALAKAALTQTNLSLAKEYLSRVKEQLSEADFDIKAEYDYCFNLGKMIVAKMKLNEGTDGLTMYLNVWQGISKQISSSMDTDSESSRTHIFRCNFVLGQLVSTILPVIISQKVPPGLLKAVSNKLQVKDSKESVIEGLKNKGLEYFEAAKSISENVDFCATAKSDTYLELTKYLLKFSNMNHFSEFERLFKYLLKAMSLGSVEARELFGCMMNLSHLVVDTGSFEALTAESNIVPSWMFLTWINQILANLESEIFAFLKTILLRIAQDYPNALRYPFMLSKTRLESRASCTKSLSECLSKMLLNNVLYENFVNSINYLAQPDLILRHYLEKALMELELEKPDLRQAKSILDTLHQMMFAPKFDKFRGPVFSWWEKFKPGMDDLLKSEGDVLKKKIKEVLASIENFKMPSKRALGFLESYCPWLRSFHCLKVDSSLELPGQYNFNYKPISKYLVTVSSFKNDVLVFNSKCRPVRISILGNDALEHKFLIKFGEDLRQDERIQQVFRHFNYKLKENKQTVRFSIDTYKVIPLSFSLGMIEWIENNVSLLEIIENALGNDADMIAKAQNEHLKFLAQGSALAPAGSVKGAVAAHLVAYETLTREAAITAFNTRVQSFPGDLLKKCFLNLSTSPEHFIYLRGNFATSYAVTCITHWLVGIGDRHLQNILVSTKTGRVLGIDFGYAFGFATHFLTPPELVPFRLTPQILALMHPLNESGWIKQTMIHCLRVFRKEHLGLLSILEVFALEPVMDWLEQARRSPRRKTDTLGNWYPRQKISMVQGKLNGANPVMVFEADLVAGNSGSKYLHKYLEVLQGIERDNIRARCAKEGLTEEEQVECLIDLATDRHVLAKTFIGWNPWL